MQGRFPDFYFLCSPHTIEVSGFTSHLFKATLENKETSNVSTFIHHVLQTLKQNDSFIHRLSAIASFFSICY